MAVVEESEISEIQKVARTFLQDRKRAYQGTFGENNVAAQAVLDDLRQFCFAERSCYDPDPRIHAVAEGRREVWLRIKDHLGMSIDELESRYSKVKGKDSWKQEREQ